MPREGVAYIFLLPYEIHTAAELRASLEIETHERRIRVYPPFKNGEGLRLHRPLDLSSAPFPDGTIEPSQLLPELNIDGRPGWPSPFVLADALRVDVYEQEEIPLAIADEIGKRLLRLLRMVTRQWWIMRGASESLAPLQNHFPINAQGQPFGTINRTQHILPWLGTEVLVTEETLRIACAYLATGTDIPTSCSTLLDAVFAVLHDDISQAVLLAAIACEALFAEESSAAVQRQECTSSVARRSRNIKDLRARVDVGARDVFSRSFTEEEPQHAAQLGSLWIARHALAHGSKEQQQRSPVLNDRACGVDALKGAFSFFEWIANLHPRDIPDPLAVFRRPLLPAA